MVDYDDEERVTDLSNPEITDKYKAAANITNQAVAYVASLCQPGANIYEICVAGDEFITNEAAKVYNGKAKKIQKGISFPTSISVNNVVGHFSPLASDAPVFLQEGDVVKIDLGAHVDGLASQIGHTIIATSNPAEPIVGRRADAVCAAHFAGECALHLAKPGVKASEVITAIKQVSEVFGCNPVLGVSTQRVDRFAVVGEKFIPNRIPEGEKFEDFSFEANEAYIFDVVMSTGEGKPKEGNVRTSIFRKTNQIYNLKLKASRYILNEISQTFGTMPFSLRSLDEKRARLGLNECLKNEVLEDYPVLFEKEGEIVAQFKFTVLILPNSTQKLNAYGLPYVQSEFNITDAGLLNIMSSSLSRKSAKKKRRNKKPAAAAAGDSMDIEA